MEADAVSALNSLSNSPARSLLNRLPIFGEASAIAATATANGKKGDEDGQSLFAKAVGGVRERDKKRRRKLNF